MIDVTCAVIRNEDNEVLVVQRGPHTDHPLKWEFPGGKIQSGETEEECIIREITEELSIDIVIVSRLKPIEHDYGFRQIRLIPFVCDTLDELPFLSEHVAFRWTSSGDLQGMDFSEADIPVAEQYLEMFAERVNEKGHEVESDEDEASEAELQTMVGRIMGAGEAEWVARSAADNPAILQRLLKYSFEDDTKLAFRASWILSKADDLSPGLLAPHLLSIIGKLGVIDNESVQRSFLRILSLANIETLGSREHGLLADHCFGMLRSGISPVAVKVYSMEILYKLAKIYPELTNELIAAISILEPEGKAALISRGRQILKKL